MDNIQDEAKKQIKEIEGKYMEAFEERMNEGPGSYVLFKVLFDLFGIKLENWLEVKTHYEAERETLISKFNDLRDLLNQEREEGDTLRKKIRQMQQ